MKQKIINKIAIVLLLLVSFSGICANNSQKEESMTDVIMHHIANSHEYHLLDWNGHPISIPLPVILWTDNGWVVFLSSEFHHDNKAEVQVHRKGMSFVRSHGKIYYAPSNDGQLQHRPIDFSITKNVIILFVISLLMIIVFVNVARSYKTNKRAPKGLASFIEPLILFVRDDIAIPIIGKSKAYRYTPYLLTIFFLIWIGNLLGLVPFVSSTLTNDILFTGTMALFTFLITLFSANKNYWKHIFAMPGVPKWLLPIMIPVELLGIFTKPFALMIRLFANITAGHVVLLSLVSLSIVLKTLAASPLSIFFGLFISFLELMVAFLQAYVFTLLSALFIGQAIEEEHH